MYYIFKVYLVIRVKYFNYICLVKSLFSKNSKIKVLYKKSYNFSSKFSILLKILKFKRKKI